MKAGAGKRKGSLFERDICKKLSRWISKGKSSDCFWRSAMSGGRATVGHKRGEMIRQAGDICSVSPEGHALTDLFYIELKNYKSLELGQFLLGKGLLMKFWLETCKQAARHKRDPWLICKQNRFPTLLLTVGPVALEVTVAQIWCKSRSHWCHVYLLDDILKAPPQAATGIVRYPEKRIK